MMKNSVLTKSISHHVPEIFRFLKHANTTPNVFQSGFSNSSKYDEKLLGGGGVKFVSGL